MVLFVTVSDDVHDLFVVVAGVAVSSSLPSDCMLGVCVCVFPVKN